MNEFINNKLLNQYSNSLKKTRLKLGANNVREMTEDYGVGGNTFRAYRDFKYTPSSVYRIWAEERTEEIIKSPPTELITNESNFRKWHKTLSNSLNKTWREYQRKKLSLAHCYKLTDLYIKWLSQYNFNDNEFIKNLNNYSSCALDRQSLNKINECYGHCLPYKNPRMGNITNQNTYNYCQEIINNFCVVGGGTKLEFDYWAWKSGG